MWTLTKLSRLARLWPETLVLLATCAGAVWASQQLPVTYAYAAVVTLATSLALFLGYRQRSPYRAQLVALKGLVSSWREGDFSTSIALPDEPALADLTRTLNALGDALRSERGALVQRELLLDTMIQNSPTALILFDQSQVVTYANVAARQLCVNAQRLEGLRLSELQKLLPDGLLHADLSPGEALVSAIGLPQALDQPEQNIERYQRSCRHFKLQGNLHILLMLRSVTQALVRSEVSAWKQVFRLMSHELNNSLAPIASLSRSAQTLIDRSDTAKARQVLDTVNERSQHLSQFLDRYARFARLPAPELKATAWEPLLRGAIAAASAGELSECAVHGFASAQLDAVQIEQALLNLIKNAVEAGSPSDAIQISLKRIGDRFCLRISDAGQGMSDSVMQQALLPFFSTKREGSGIGLALVREIIEAHGGSIQLASHSPQGLVVTMWFPG